MNYMRKKEFFLSKSKDVTLTSELVAKYKEYTVAKLLGKCQAQFNLFIRNRDMDSGGKTFYCPTCNRTKPIQGKNYQACHLYPAGHFPAIRFNELNVHGGCLACNYFKHGAGYSFSPYVEKKIGRENFERLQILANSSVRSYKWDRYTLIEKIEKYKKLNKDFN